MIRPAARYANAERCDLRTLYVHTGCAGATLCATIEQVDHRLLEQPDEALHLDAAARKVDERVDHDLAWTVIRDVAAAIGAHHRDAAWHQDFNGALAKRVDRWVLEQPEFIRGVLVALARELAHRAQHGQVVLAPLLVNDDTFKSHVH